MRVDFHPEATAELETSADWYLLRGPSAAQGFALAVETALDRIARFPERYPRIDAHHRSGNVENYPFQIIYRDDDQRIYIIAIAHAKRRPGYWKRRG